eukprot:CAMPEP_0184691952 /NCGR_PEP_ID=MMETSP0313-20130426/630_1 /TAXON_ID=2792 /ORGANISM="Porphyridium aerugineum, Strain SAG 1380-2" /LENGTH=105 /DNA_ID=CAMNT_0027149737 /DNA_START=1553 /DNA_END=1871 /DNA_ORIENTATION=+
MAFIAGGISGVALATPSKTSKLSQVRYASPVSRRNSRIVVALRDNEGDPSITEERRREVMDKTRRVVNEKFGWTSSAEFLNDEYVVVVVDVDVDVLLLFLKTKRL